MKLEYYIKDHLDKVRGVFDEKGKILQQTDYYLFGLEISRDTPVSTQAVRNGVNRYNFPGKELQVGTGYMDLSRRFYDPALGGQQRQNDGDGFSCPTTKTKQITEKYAK